MLGGIAIRDFGDGACKYCGALVESDKIKIEEIKLKVRQDYYRRVKKVLKSSMNGGNTIKAINTWAVAVVRYAAGVVD